MRAWYDPARRTILMENISIEMTQEEANELRAALEEATEVMRQTNERIEEREKDFDANQRELREIIARIAAINFHVETNS